MSRVTVSKVRRNTEGAKTLLEQLRLQAGLGIREVAEYSNVSKATISRVENGKSPDITTALRLARFFETTVEELFKSHGEDR